MTRASTPLIAPSSNMDWRVSSALDDRIEGQRSMLDIQGRKIILPRPQQFYPKGESLRWRESQLLN